MTRSWVVACGAAETIGMAAAAGAARSAAALTDRDITHAAAWGLLIIVLGGLVEGTALGWLQGQALRATVGRTGRRKWALATALVAGLGWAAASVPAVVAGDDGGGNPPLPLVLLGAAGLGGVMGALLGAAQVSTTRHQARHLVGWVVGSTAGWAVAMPVIFLGATTVPASWPWWLVVASGAVTGLAAGSALGVVSGSFLDALERSTHTGIGLDQVARVTELAVPAGTSSHDEGDSARTEGDRAEAGWWAKGWEGAASAFPTAPGTRTKEQS